MAEYINEKDSLNTGREKINKSIQDSEDAKNIANDADVKSAQALSNSESTQEQLDQVVIEGDSSVEAAQARVNADGTVTYDNLKERLDSEHQEVSSQLRDASLKTFYNKTGVHKKPKAMLVIQDDDTNKRLYTDVFPILQELNVPITAGAITGRIGNADNTITLEQYYEMQKSGLVEFVSHTVTHRNLATEMDLIEAEQELIESKEWLLRHGGNPDYFIPPFAGDTAEIQDLIRKYYKGSFKTFTTGYILSPPMISYSIRRSEFEVTKVDLETQKGRLDEALATGSLIIVNTHSSFGTFDPLDFRELLEHAISIGLEIVTTSEAMQHFGNLFEIESNPFREDYAVIDSNGDRHGELDSRYFYIDATDVTPDKPADEFKKGVSVSYFTIDLANQYGWPSAGVVETHKTGNVNYTFQHFIPLQSNDTMFRFWDGSEWSEWSKTNSIYNHISRTGITSETPISNFSEGVSVCTYNASAAEGAGFSYPGVLSTHKMSSDAYSYQRYVYLSDNIELHRFWKGDRWSDFVNISGNDSGSTSTRNEMVTDDLDIGHCFFDTTLRKPIWWTGSIWVDAAGEPV